MTKQQANNEAALINKLRGYNGHKSIALLKAQLGLGRKLTVVV